MSTEDLKVAIKKRGCRHPQTQSKFCSECGKPMFIESKKDVDFPSNGEVKAYCHQHEAKERFVGFKIKETEGYESVPFLAEETRQNMALKIEEACRAQGLTVNPSLAQLYMMLYESY